MIIYWSMLLWIIVTGTIANITANRVEINGIIERRAKLWSAVFTFSVIILFSGLRSDIADTRVYIESFIRMPLSLSEFFRSFSFDDKAIGFVILSAIFRALFKDFHIWLFAIALISGICTMLPIKKYSPNFAISMFIFVSSCMLTWMFNGIRQFLVATILFACCGLIIRKKMLWFFLVIILLSTIHSTVLILIPIYFIVQGEAWNKKTIILILISIVILFFSQQFLGILDSTLQGSSYSEDIKYYADIDNGTNIIRVFVAAVPTIIAFIFRKKIRKIATVEINIFINMSIISSAIYLISSVTSGILIGRLPIYFDLYNLILLPWLIEKLFRSKERILVYYAMCGLYLLFFYYQMVITWNGFGYISDVLKINF